jgi:DNA-binding MarR family transcriptional regulator
LLKYTIQELLMSESFEDVPALELVEIFHRLFRLRLRQGFIMPADLASVRAQLVASHLEAKAGSADDFALLHNVGRLLSRQHEPMTMGELSRALDIPLSSATRIVDWLVQSHFVARQSDPEDRRVVRVALTEAGLETYRVTASFARERIEKLLEHFTSAERQALVPLLRKLVEALETEL